MHIVLFNVQNSEGIAMNKDLNGGLGTADNYGTSITSKIIAKLKSRWVKLPVLSFAFLQAIFKGRRDDVVYHENIDDIKKSPDLVLIYGSIVDYKNENEMCKKIKGKFPNTKVAVFGPFPSRFSQYFPDADAIFKGEAEAFFMYDFRELGQLSGDVQVSKEINMNDLPTPDFDGFPIQTYRYYPAIKETPFLVLQASKGCPYSCGYYCTYGEYQGAKYRQRSAEKVVQDIITLQKKYNVKGIQFRDPTFGLHKQFTKELCELIIKKNIKIAWGMETRLDLLNKELIDLLYQAGLRNINAGIETPNKEIAAKNKRMLVQNNHQEDIIKYCLKKGINISAFYIIGYEGDNAQTINETFKYAMHLNTPMARFSVSTPYPGTKFYEQLKNGGRITSDNFNEYTQFNLVFKHNVLSREQVNRLLQSGMRRYYFRPKYVMGLLKW